MTDELVGVPGDLGVQGAPVPAPAADPAVGPMSVPMVPEPPGPEPLPGAAPMAPPAPASAPMAPVTPAAAPAIAPAEEETPIGMLKDYIPPELYQQLLNQSQDKMSLAEAFALAGLAGANAPLAQQHIANRSAKVRDARSTLAQIGMASGELAAKHATALELARKTGADEATKAFWKQRGEQTKDIADAAHDKGISIMPPPNAGDDAAWQNWFYNVSRKIESAEGDDKKDERRQQITGEVLPVLAEMGKAGAPPGAIAQSAMELLTQYGVTSEEMGEFTGMINAVVGISQASQAQAQKDLNLADTQMQIGLTKLADSQRTMAIAEKRLEQEEVQNYLDYGRLAQINMRMTEQEIAEQEKFMAHWLGEGANPEAAMKNKEAIARLQSHQLVLQGQMQIVAAKAHELMQGEDPAQTLQQAFVGRIGVLAMQLQVSPDRFIDNPGQVIGWLNENPGHPMAQGFWQGVAGDLMVGRPENSRDLIRSYIERGANNLRNFGTLDPMADYMPPTRQPMAPAPPPPGNSQ